VGNSSPDLVQRGLALHKAGHTEGAAALYEQALTIDPTSFDALQFLALIRFRSGQVDVGIRLFERALAIAPRHASTLNNYGNALLAAGRWANAVVAYRSAIEVSTKSPPVIFRNLGIALVESGSDEDAKRFFERAISGDPSDVEAINRLAGLAVKQRDWLRADTLYTQSLTLHPSLAVKLARLMARQNLTLWDEWDHEVAEVSSTEPADDEQVDPFKLMFIVDSPSVQRRYAEAFGRYGQRRAYVPETLRQPKEIRGAEKRISIGYLSFDIRRHPVAQLVAGVLENHDVTRFAVTVHALGPESDDPERVRIRNACERFELHAGRSEADSIKTIRQADHDILIDLMGYTRDAKPSILVARPAHIQVGWLGYPGTLGAGLLDALIADDYVIPGGSEADYSEEILRVADCYLPADRTRRVNPPRSRESYGFREQDVIVACFCQLQKITPKVFELWMQCLASTSNIVLWLFGVQAAAADRLRARVAQNGIAPDRLHFTDFVADHADHLARYAVADFAVDTYPYGSHTTAIDALWVGCPLIAFSGDGFASRVSGSVLRAAGVSELIAHSAEEYRDLIQKLAVDPVRRRYLREYLIRNRESCPLFDVRRFTRNYEQILLNLASRSHSGLQSSDNFRQPEPQADNAESHLSHTSGL
jgi:predicted O-linked N-acetylglucosamine transferase (SPINDLY family)